MSAVAGDAATRFSAQVARRWQPIDPLLPASEGLPPACGAELIAAGADGQPTANLSGHASIGWRRPGRWT